MSLNGDEASLNPQPLPPIADFRLEPWQLSFQGGHPEPWRSGPHPDPWGQLASMFITAVSLREAARQVDDGGLIQRIAQQMIEDCGNVGPRRPLRPIPGFEEPQPRPNWASAALASAVLAQAVTLPNPDLQAAALAAARDLLPAGRG